jgi:hypothetical protein
MLNDSRTYSTSVLTKLGYLIDNPWSNALDRAKSAGSVLADVLIHRHLGVRPITLIGFSLGARVIFYALLELAKQKAFGIVQDVFILGTTVTAPTNTWLQARSAVSGRFVNGYARNDWVLNYLFRATSGGLNTVAGLRPVENVPGLENVDVTDKISGHMSYRTFMPLILDQLGFPVTADFFDEPVVSAVDLFSEFVPDSWPRCVQEPDFEGDRIVVREEDEPKKRRWFSRKKKSSAASPRPSRPPTAASLPSHRRQGSSQSTIDDELPPREDRSHTPTPGTPALETPATGLSSMDASESDVTTPGTPTLPKHAGFDFKAIQEALGKAELTPEDLQIPAPTRFQVPFIPPPTQRSESAPPPAQESPSPSTRSRPSLDLSEQPVAGSSSSNTDLSSTLLRSMSLNDIRGEAETQDALTAADERTPSTNQPFRIPSPISLSSDDNLPWTAETDRTPPAYSASNPFSPAFEGRSAYDPLRPSGSGSYGLSRLPDNPFAPPDSSGLSFGTADGSITFTPLSTTAPDPSDPWSIPTPSFGGFSSKKSASSYNVNANPWQN